MPLAQKPSSITRNGRRRNGIPGRSSETRTLNGKAATVPQIPTYLTERELPGAGGIQGGVVGTPVVTQPGAERARGAVLDEALAAIPQGIQTLGQAGVQIAGLQLREEELQL